MGKLFLIFLIANFSFITKVLYAETSIQLMPPPVRVLPPALPEPSLLEKKNKKRPQRQRRSSSAQETPPAAQKNATSIPTQLSEEAHKERAYTLMMQVSLVLPTLKTRHQRRSYTTEPTSHFSLFMRASQATPPDQTQLWWGLRLAPFAGTGVYEGTPGRYGFLYFGPMIGLGKINRPSETRTQQAASSQERGSQESLPSRNAWFLMAGIAAQTRMAATDPGNAPVDQDFNTVRGAKLDGSGLWAELTYSVIYFGTIGTHYVAGVQLGEGKTFYWLGVAAGGWY